MLLSDLSEDSGAKIKTGKSGGFPQIPAIGNNIKPLKWTDNLT